MNFEEAYGYAPDPDDDKDVMAMEILRYNNGNEPDFDDFDGLYDDPGAPDDCLYHSCTENFEVSLGFYIRRLEEGVYCGEDDDRFRSKLQSEILEMATQLRIKVLALQAYEEHYTRLKDQ